MASASDKKKKEQDRIKKQLAVLGFMLVLVVVVNRNKILGTGTGAKIGTQTAKAAGSSNLPETPSATGASGATPLPAAASGSPGGPAQTPFDIPELTPEVVAKLKARHDNRQMSDDEVDPHLFLSTVDPFTSFTSDIEIAAAAEKGSPTLPAAPSQTRVSAGPRTAEVPRALQAYHAFGVMVLDGEKQAIIKRDGRVVPYHLKEGDHFDPPDDNFRIQITGDNRVWIENAEATRSDEKYFELSGNQPHAVNPSSAPSTPLSTNNKASGAEASQIYLDEQF